MNAKVAGVGTLVLLVFLFVVQNAEMVGIRVLFWEIRVSRVVLILGTGFIGFLAGYLLGKMKSKSPPENA